MWVHERQSERHVLATISLDVLARAMSQEQVEIVRAIGEAREIARNRPAPMDGEELARVVSEVARNGSVQAAKLRWKCFELQAASSSRNRTSSMS